MNANKIVAKFGRLYNAPQFYHVLFWAFLFVFLVVLNRTQESWLIIIVKNLLNVLFFMTLTYINTLYLIPTLLSKKKILLFIFALTGIILLIAPIKTTAFYLIHSGEPVSQQFYLENIHLPIIELALVAIASSIYKLIVDIIYHQNKTQELERQNLTSELRFLKSQIDPHFFFNTLNSLYALTLKKSDQAPDTVLKLSNMMRYMLYECNDKTVPLSKEIQYIRDYIDLESIRHNDNFDIKFNIEGDPTDKQIMPLVFSPFIENSFKHGSMTDGGSYIYIDLKIKDDHLFFNIANSKLPLLDKKDNIGGIGLSNVKRRLNLVYSGKHMLKINEKPNDYELELYLNLENNNA